MNIYSGELRVEHFIKVKFARKALSATMKKVSLKKSMRKTLQSLFQMFDFKGLFSTFNSDYSYSANFGSKSFPIPAYSSLNKYK